MGIQFFHLHQKVTVQGFHLYQKVAAQGFHSHQRLSIQFPSPSEAISSRWWKLLWIYAGFSICLLYVYQLPAKFPKSFQVIADLIVLHQASVESDWQQIISGISLMVFFYMLSCVKNDLEDMECMMSMREGRLTEQLIPSKNSYFVRQLRGGGFISLENLLYFATNFPKSFQDLLQKKEGDRALWEYPFAVAGVNITFMLIQMLDLEEVKPRTLVGATFLKFLTENELAFDLLYCITFKLMDHQ